MGVNDGSSRQVGSKAASPEFLAGFIFTSVDDLATLRKLVFNLNASLGGVAAVDHQLTAGDKFRLL